MLVSSSLIRNFHDVVRDFFCCDENGDHHMVSFCLSTFWDFKIFGVFLAKHNRILICQIYIPVLSTHIVHTYVTFTFLLALYRGELETILFSDNLGRNVRTA